MQIFLNPIVNPDKTQNTQAISGMANFQISHAYKSMPFDTFTFSSNKTQEELSFWGKTTKKVSIKPKQISIEQRKELEKKCKKIKVNPYYLSDVRTTLQMEIAQKVLSDKRLYSNRNFMSCLNYIISVTKSEKNAKAIIKIIDKVLSDEKLYCNVKLMNDFGPILADERIADHADDILGIINNVLSDEKLNNEDFIGYLGRILTCTNNQKETETKIQKINKALDVCKSSVGNDFVQSLVCVLFNQGTSNILKEKSRIIEKVLSDEKFYENENLIMQLVFILSKDTVTDQGTKIVNKVLSDEKLYNNKHLIRYLGDISCYTNTQVQAEIVNKILQNEKLYNNKKLISYLGDILCNTKTPEQAEIKIKIIDKVLQHEKLYKNENIMMTLGYTLRNTETQEQAEIKIKIIDKVLQNEKLYNNENIMMYLGDILVRTKSQVQAEFVNKVLQNEKLYKNENIMMNLGRILYNTETPEQAEIKIKIIDKVLQNEKLYNNENIMMNLGHILLRTESKVQAEIVNKVLQNEKLYKNENIMMNLGDILFPIESQVQVALVQKLLDDNDFPKNKIAVILQYTTATTIEEAKIALIVAEKTINSMKQRRDQLKSGLEDLPDSEIEKFALNNYKQIETTKKLLGESGFIDAFGLKMAGLEKLVDDLANLYNGATPENLQKILEIFAPQESEKGKRIAKIVAQLNARNSELAKIKELAIKKPIMDVYNARKKKLTAQLYERQKVLKSMTSKDKIEKLRILAAMQEMAPDKMEKSIKIINNPELLKKAVNEGIFAMCNVPYDEKVSQKLGLEKSEFLTSIATSNPDFKENLRILIETVQNHPEMSIGEALDTLPQNIVTRETFEKLGLNYDRWIHPDKNSFETVQVTLNADKAKAAVIHSLESDFNDAAFKLIPKEEQEKIFVALKEKGITLEEETETLFDANGVATGTKKSLKLKYKGEPMPFEKMETTLSTIKEVMNKNEFWTVSSEDSTINEAKNTIHNHMIKLRGNELDIAKNAKGEKTTSLEIRQTDMTDLAHSMFLGNHGACCIAVGSGINQFSAPTYIMNRLISAIEVVDGKNFVGNSMIYITEVDGKPALMIDNIELSAKYQFNDAIRDAFFTYAHKLCTEIGKPDLPVYAGPHRHKLNMPEETKVKRQVKILGSTGKQEIYIDWKGRYIVDGEKVENIDTYEIQ